MDKTIATARESYLSLLEAAEKDGTCLQYFKYSVSENRHLKLDEGHSYLFTNGTGGLSCSGGNILLEKGDDPTQQFWEHMDQDLKSLQNAAEKNGNGSDPVIGFDGRDPNHIVITFASGREVLYPPIFKLVRNDNSLWHLLVTGVSCYMFGLFCSTLCKK